MKLFTKYQKPGPSSFRRRFLKFFPICVYVKQVAPGKRHFLPQGYNLRNLGSGPLDEVTYQISKAWDF